MRYAIVESGVVTNVVIADEAMNDNWVETNIASINWLYDGSNFLPPIVQPVIPTRDEQEAKRRSAYIIESDPIFFMTQRGEATREEWLAKIEEIKVRYPYPVE